MNIKEEVKIYNNSFSNKNYDYKVEIVNDKQIRIRNFPGVFGDVINKNGLIIDSFLLEREVKNYKNLINIYPYQRYMLDGHAEKNALYAYSYDLVIGYVEDIRYNKEDKGVYIDFLLFNKDNIFEKIIEPGFPLGVSSIFYPIEKHTIRYDFYKGYFDSLEPDLIPPHIKDYIHKSIKDYKYFEFYFDDMLYFEYLSDGRLLRFDVVQLPAYETFISGLKLSNLNTKVQNDIIIIGDLDQKYFEKNLIKKLSNLYDIINSSLSKKIIEKSIKYLDKSPNIFSSSLYLKEITNILNTNEIQKKISLEKNIRNSSDLNAKITPFYLDFFIKDYIAKYRNELNMNKIYSFSGYKPLICNNK